jgi:hypothetical protein
MIFIFSLFFVFALVWSISQPSRVERCINKAVHTQNITPISEEIERRPLELQSRFFDQSMGILWEKEKRNAEDTKEGDAKKITVKLLQDLCLFFVQNNPTSSAGHKWISKIQKQHPQIITDTLLQHYDCTYANKKEAG